jgi:hypothetical protein
MSRAQHILAVIVGLITGVLLMESYGAMVTAARAGGRAIPELWPLGTEALALAMEVSVLEAKRLGIGPCCGCRGCYWLPRSPYRRCSRWPWPHPPWSAM